MSEFPDIPGYELHRELGRGGMASVYLATQKSLDRQVALKVMATALAADPSFTERFLREARTVAKLQHPAIVPVYDMGVAGHLHFIAMEYVSGGDLKRRLRGAAMLPADALRVLWQIAEALDFAHDKGFVHRDVKPENILFRDGGSAVLSDFGIARAMRGATRMTGTGMSLGTPHYMSPEQARGQDVDGRSDLYSLGVVFHEMLTGKLPYTAQDSLAVVYRHVNDPLPTLPRELAEWQPLLNRLMAKDPAERFQSGREVVAALSEGPTALRDARRLGTAGQKRSGRRQVYVWATVAMLMSVAAVLAFAVASGWTGSGEDHGDRSDASVDPGSKGGGSSVADPGLPRLAGAPSRPECARAYALVDQVGVSLGKDELFAAVEQLREGSGGFADDADCVESGVYQSQLLVAGAHVVKEMQDVERLESVLNQAMQKADSDLEQLQRLAQLARLSGDGIGAAEAAVAIENSQASIANMRERAERVEQRRARLNAAGRTLAALIDAHGAWARLEPERAYQTVASQVGMQDLQRQLTIFLASSQDAWRDGE